MTAYLVISLVTIVPVPNTEPCSIVLFVNTSTPVPIQISSPISIKRKIPSRNRIGIFTFKKFMISE